MFSENDFKKAPAYLQIREYIYNKIITGEYKAGDKLPAEDKLAEQFSVSRMTVNKALMELVNREYVTRIQGSGTFVSKMRKEGSSLGPRGFNDSLTQKGFKVRTVVLEQKMIAPSRDIADMLNLSMKDSILYLKRLRLVHDEPIVVQEAYLTKEISKPLSNVDFTKESLYESIRNLCQMEVVRAKDQIEAKAADEVTSKLLGVEEGFPILLSRRTAYDKESRPLELSYSHYRSDQYVLEVEYQ